MKELFFFFSWFLVIKVVFTSWFTISLVFALCPVVESLFPPFLEGCCILAFEKSSISYWSLPLIPPIFLQRLDSDLTFLSLVFRVLAPYSPSIQIPGVLLSCAKTRQIISLPLPLCLILISVLCSAAWKARCPVSLCNSSLWAPPGLFLPSNFCNGLQPFFSWFYEHLEVLKWIQFPSAWMAQNQIFLLYTKRQMCIWCLWRLPLFRDLLLECWGMIKNLRSSKNITRISADSTYISVLTTST